jgi:5-carboxymethyl-2-hydroxymuconate isomerase
MPHAIIEHSVNLNAGEGASSLPDIVHQTMIASGLFNANDVKTRLHPVSDYRVGVKGAQGNFVHILIYLLEGRTLEQKQALTQNVFDALQSQYHQPIEQLSVDIQDMARATYRKSAS